MSDNWRWFAGIANGMNRWTYINNNGRNVNNNHKFKKKNRPKTKPRAKKCNNNDVLITYELNEFYRNMVWMVSEEPPTMQ